MFQFKLAFSNPRYSRLINPLNVAGTLHVNALLHKYRLSRLVMFQIKVGISESTGNQTFAKDSHVNHDNPGIGEIHDHAILLLLSLRTFN